VAAPVKRKSSGEEEEEGKAEGGEKAERRKSSRLEKKVDTVEKPDKVLKKRHSTTDGNGSDGEAGEKKRPKYSRAPPGSLANPDWDRVLGLDAQSQWSELLKKDHLTPFEQMQEAAFTELINKRSLEQLEKLENERVNELADRKSVFDPDEQIIRFTQSARNGVLASTFTYPSADHFPKNFNTKISKKDAGKFAPALCAITGAPARYRDPLTQLPYADKEAFKIIRERYFQKEEDKLIVRISVLTDLLAQKRDKLRRYQQAGKNLDLPDGVRNVINAQQQ